MNIKGYSGTTYFQIEGNSKVHVLTLTVDNLVKIRGNVSYKLSHTPFRVTMYYNFFVDYNLLGINAHYEVLSI